MKVIILRKKNIKSILSITRLVFISLQGIINDEHNGAAPVWQKLLGNIHKKNLFIRKEKALLYCFFTIELLYLYMHSFSTALGLLFLLSHLISCLFCFSCYLFFESLIMFHKCCLYLFFPFSFFCYVYWFI